ncbi:MAG: CPBP family intramembrane glutamic endopeptidase [Bacteroidota bacterium]
MDQDDGFEDRVRLSGDGAEEAAPQLAPMEYGGDGSPAARLTPALIEPWRPGELIRLDGVAERNGFGPLMMAFFGLVVAFILFQVVISPIAVFILLAANGVSMADLANDLAGVMAEQVGALLTANTIGQFLGLALPTFVLVRLHTKQTGAFLRIRRADPLFLLLSAVGLVAFLPTVQWLGSVNEMIPLPESIQSFEQQQMELIEGLLTSGFSLWFGLFVLAITPGLCEEVLFRGYIQRLSERSLGILGGILFSGIIFGLYHLRISQALPLSALGIYLAYLTWRSGSLWPAIVVHIMNNAIALGVGRYVEMSPDLSMADFENMEIPWYLVVLSVTIFSGLFLAMQRRAERLLDETPEVLPTS